MTEPAPSPNSPLPWKLDTIEGWKPGIADANGDDVAREILETADVLARAALAPKGAP